MNKEIKTVEEAIEVFRERFTVFDGNQNIVKHVTYSSWVESFISDLWEQAERQATTRMIEEITPKVMLRAGSAISLDIPYEMAVDEMQEELKAKYLPEPRKVIIVGSSNADYVVDSVDDHLEIQKAIDAIDQNEFKLHLEGKTISFDLSKIVNKAEPRSFFDMPEDEKRQIITKAAQESNRMQQEFMEDKEE